MTRHRTSALADCRQRLATAIAAALMVPAASMAGAVAPLASGQQVADGNIVTLDPGDYATSNEGEAVIIARNGGTITSSGPITVVSSGQQAAGAQATGPNSSITLIGSSVTTSGNGAMGLDARTSGKIYATNSVISTTGIGATGANISGASAEVVLSNSTVSTTGESAHAMNVEKGGRASLTFGSLKTAGESANGVTVMGTGSEFLMDRASIVTEGDHGRGIYTGANTSGAIVEIKGRAAADTPATITTEGAFATGVEIDGNGNTVKMTDVVIGTKGQGARGVHLDGDGHTVTADNVRITTDGADAEAISNRGGTVEVRNSVLTTTGSKSHGLYAGQSTTEGATPTTRAART